MKTDRKRGAKAKPGSQKTEQPRLSALDASVHDPPKLFILPKDVSADARIVSLPSLLSSAPANRLFVCPEKGFHELTRVAAPKNALRSWLLAPDRCVIADSGRADSPGDDGYVLQKPDLFIATPADPLFVVLPLLARESQKPQGSFLTFSDYMYDQERQGYAQLQQLLRQPIFAKQEKLLEHRLEAVSDLLDLGNDDEKMYQLSLSKLVDVLVAKVTRMTLAGLPMSMDERFIRQELEMPVLSVKREQSSLSIATEEDRGLAPSETASTCTSQETDSSSTTVQSASTTATSVLSTPLPAASAPEEVIRLLRIRTALDYILVTSVPSSLHRSINAMVRSEGSKIDFQPLNAFMQRIASLKQEAQALRSLSDNISRKRKVDDDEEAMEKAETKKRKTEEEELRKKNTSHGVKKLMKANTSGMKKLSSFFSKPSTAKN